MRSFNSSRASRRPFSTTPGTAPPTRTPCRVSMASWTRGIRKGSPRRWVGDHRKSEIAAMTQLVDHTLHHLVDPQQLGTPDQLDEHLAVEVTQHRQRSPAARSTTGSGVAASASSSGTNRARRSRLYSDSPMRVGPSQNADSPIVLARNGSRGKDRTHTVQHQHLIRLRRSARRDPVEHLAQKRCATFSAIAGSVAGIEWAVHRKRARIASSSWSKSPTQCTSTASLTQRRLPRNRSSQPASR